MMFLDCPAYADEEGTTRCGLPAEVEYRYTVQSSDGPLESAKIRCPRGHWFNAPLQYLTVDEHYGQPAAQADGNKTRRPAPPPSRSAPASTSP